MKTRHLDLHAGGASPVRCLWVKALQGWVGQQPISRGQYEAFRAPTPGPAALEAARAVMLGVSWDDAARFCQWLNLECANALPRHTVIHLPRQVEWASCAGCRPVTDPSWGDICPDFSPESELQAERGSQVQPYAGAPNDWGLVMPAPGVWEWTGDLYDPTMNCRILRGACTCGGAGGGGAVRYYLSQFPERGYANVAFRVLIGQTL